MLVSYRCRVCHRPMVSSAHTWYRRGSDAVLCGCGGSIEQITMQYTGSLKLRDDGFMYPRTHRRVSISVAQEVAEIRARHAKLREYNRIRQAAYNRARKTKKASTEAGEHSWQK